MILSLARVPQPRIGSFRLNADGTVSLTNRPLPSDETYSCPEPFVADMLALHEGAFLAHRNAVFDTADCRCQLAARALLRTVSHFYVSWGRRAGPFYLQLTDLYASNLLVDDDWNITCLIDLEWISSLPAEMLSVPYWLTGRGIDELEEEGANSADGKPALARIMCNSWESGAVWFWRCLTSVDAAFQLVEDLVSPRFCPFSCKVEQVLSEYWCQDSAAVVTRKSRTMKSMRKNWARCLKGRFEDLSN